ncbi:MAG: energy transducer TonB [Melioribacteraceae bacterium]|nr:energy transducer TonB [Melioribacteraceae bacterium]
MALPKNPKYDLKRTSQRVFEVSLIVSLMVTILAFKFFPNVQNESETVFVPQDLINVEDIANTVHENKPPPPPKPPIPIEAAIEDEAIEDLTIDETDFNDEPIDAPPPMIEEEEEEDDGAYMFIPVEEQPYPIGGVAAILKKIEYPDMAKRAGIQGKVYVHAYVDVDGTVTKVELIKGIGAGCDEEALNAVLKSEFSPGRQRGKAVRVRVAVPVIFRLQ